MRIGIEPKFLHMRSRGGHASSPVIAACSAAASAERSLDLGMSKVLLAGESASTNNSVSSLPNAPPAAAADSGKYRVDAAEPAQSTLPTRVRQRVDFPTQDQRERHFLIDLLGPGAFIAPAFQAGVDEARPLKVGYPADGFEIPGKQPGHGDVPEWGEGAQGHAKRYASRFGRGLIDTTTRYALGEVSRKAIQTGRCARWIGLD